MTPIAGRSELEIFIDNKVYTVVDDSKTTRCFEACGNCGDERPFRLFVYLTPQPLRDMDCYAGLNKGMRPECSHYIHICYQDILDCVIEPLLVDEGLGADKRNMLREYVGCLELPAVSDSESGQQENDFSIMAIGSGQLDGKGLNNNTTTSVKNGNFLSEEHTDFIFSVSYLL